MACAEGRKPDRSVISWRRMISMPILLISWRQLPTRPKLADHFDMSQLSEDAAVRRLGDRLGFGLSGNALIEAQQRRLTATPEAVSLSPADGDSGAEQTPHRSCSGLHARAMRPAVSRVQRRRKPGASRCVSNANGSCCGGSTGWCEPLINYASG
jgi:hypothetical protein